MRIPLSLGAALAVACAPSPARHSSTLHTDPVYTLTAVRFGTLPAFRVRGLVAGADSGRRMDIALMIWALTEPSGRVVLVDAGFAREKFITQWKPTQFVPPDSALRLAGIDPSRVTDIIVSHIHWDHADGVERFPRARVWLQRQEFESYVGPTGEALLPAIDRDVAAMLRARHTAGQVVLIDGDDQTAVAPGIRVYTGGKHTVASQYVSVRTASGTAIVASDNAYLYENLDQARPIAQTLDSISNLAAQRRMRSLATRPDLVVPGHDPAVFARFGSPSARSVVVR